MTTMNMQSKLSSMAIAIDRLARELEPATLSVHACNAALPEIDQLIASLGSDSPALAQALTRLRTVIDAHRTRPVAKIVDGNATRRLRRALRMLAPLAAAAMALAAVPAAAQNGPPAPPPSLIGKVAVGGQVYNPLASRNETVVELIGNFAVRTDKNNVVLLAQAVGDKYTVTTTDRSTNPPTVTTNTYTVTSVTLDANNRVTDIALEDDSKVASTTRVAQAITYTLPPVGGSGGAGITPIAIPSAVGDVNVVAQVGKGGNGGNGRVGGGVEICIPFIGCATIAVSPTAGGDGATGPTTLVTVAPDTTKPDGGNISSIADNRPGVTVISAGGNGGRGGAAVGNIPAARGGTGGQGGDATAVVSVDITTSGANSHGILVQSVAGRGGDGGTGILASPGGTSGAAAQGGTARAFNSGTIATTGAGAVGMLVQSLGGNAGDSGGSYGIVGQPGQGSLGGNGGSAFAQNGGRIQTGGDFAHGMLGQSIGGSGGNVGTAAGLVTLGDAAGAGGDGGDAAVRVLGTGSILTTGAFAYGAMAQSTGGGGGSANMSVGLIVSLGSAGSAAGKGGATTVTLDRGASIVTTGIGSYGVFAESIGGGGGTSGGSFGLVTLGASAGAGGDAGLVTVDSDGSVATSGAGARGIFAQSVGGGGGNANITGGAVALGGSGAGGGIGGAVAVALGRSSSVTTTGAGADAVFAQSVGGGGGAGSFAGGLVSLGGTGGPGAGGGAVRVTNAGSILTTGVASRGIFAQSVGGGGGAGGDSYGLAAIGGTGSGTSAGGAVTVRNSGSIATAGAKSTALQVQSIGGGGGDGGTTGGVLLAIGGNAGAGGAGGVVTVEQSGGLSTRGNDSHGLFAQSVGGGGGNAGSATTLSLFVGASLGGNGGTGGRGGDATVTFAPQTVSLAGGPVTIDPIITTLGDRSRGVFAQSVGGGGGNGGFAAQATLGLGFAGSLAIGGSGGDGGAGGLVTVDGRVNVSTTGANSEGMYLQSTGGGGGSGGFSVAAALSAGPASASISAGIGGTGGLGGDGGILDVDSGGSIVTRGAFSTGFLAQSVGGGGGSGGFNVSAAVAAAKAAALSVAVGIGGSGGGGGVGGRVDALFDGAILTSGDDAPGALIQSVGGGGGRGGYNISGAVALAAAGGAGGVAFGLGGSGGSGGDGGIVIGGVGGNVQTGGARSTGVLIQSLGGGGGSGGFNVSGTAVISGGVTGGAAIGLGGVGGAAGNGNTVTGTAGGTILTLAEASDGLVVQSLGGGGGAGGFNVSGNFGAGGTASGSVSVGLGGAGGGGGNGGAVTGTARGTVETRGDRSRGVVVQSLGGGGGAGAFNVNGDLVVSGNVTGSVGVGLGGSGGGGGTGGNVTAKAVSIFSSGAQSAGFIAQSVGGGGGAGGFNVTGGVALSGKIGGNVGIGLGGSGGSGGRSGTVDATILGTVVTTGAQSGAILAQSVGGGGGSGGFNVTGGIAVGGTGGGTIGVGLGGSGGLGGAGGDVTLNINQAVAIPTTTLLAASTLGDSSSGIVAQSIGGGGGNGGLNVTGGLAAGGTGAGTIGFGLGGSGGSGGASGAVVADITGATLTRGADSNGIVAQSLGGGGGNGGFNVSGGVSLAKTGAGNITVGVGGAGGDGGAAGAVTLDVNQRTIDGDNTLVAAITQGDRATGIIAQSIGGGGGSGGFNITGGVAIAAEGAGNIGVGLGGAGGKASAGRSVTARVRGDIGTSGADAGGLLVQSVGGGGGSGGFNVTGGIAGSKSGAGNLLFGMGGFGGAGGDGGAVTGTLQGDIVTAGVGSYGATLQSLGGSGGVGGFNVTGGLALTTGGTGAGNIGVGIGGFGGGGGNAAGVTGRLTGNVLTRGSDAHGILLQSLGGGGGAGGLNVTGTVAVSAGKAGNIGFGLGGFGGDGGRAGDVDGRLVGNVTTLGANAFGAMLQSVGGSGGQGGLNVTGAVNVSTGPNASVGVALGIGGFGGAGGLAGNVVGTVSGVYTTAGANADAVIAQSIGGGGGAGGLNVSGAVALGTGKSGAASVGIGGFGGAGGRAGDVTLTRIGQTLTTGLLSDGVVAQSVGGGGGRGGIVVSAGISATTKGDAGSFAFGLGGFGGGGGDGGSVRAIVTDSVWATGSRTEIVAAESVEIDGETVTIPEYRHQVDGSNGVFVQSIGGGGGAGGMSVAGGLSLRTSDDAKARAAVIGIGGFGGSGGNGGLVDAHVGAVAGSPRMQVQGIGMDKAAVYVASIGGGGGAGGINISGGISSDGQIVAGVGGFGGAGGIGGVVTTRSDADLFASGLRATGLFVQSVGGGGGAGGINISGGIKPQSNGKEPSLVFGVGGFGGAGNASSAVTVVQSGQVRVDGEGAHGVLVQSVAGGGGMGGLSVAASINRADSKNPKLDGFALALGVGGSGGAGANAGDVRLTSAGDVLMNTAISADGVLTRAGDGANAPGILAQSVGGGGGVGGMNVTGVVAPTGTPVAIGVGGSGGAGGDAGSVTVIRGFTETNGVTSASRGLINTFGDGSTGLIAQSVGGGGGSAGINLVFGYSGTAAGQAKPNAAAIFAIGGDGASSGAGGTVVVRQLGDIQTDGFGSGGILAQSIAKGGGNAALNVGLGVMKGVSALTFALGGGAGDGGRAGNVAVSHDGTIITRKGASSAITAQSIAGGGGNVAMSTVSALRAGDKIGVAIGRSGGTGGTSGIVTVDARGELNTFGDDSNGVVAQSIGGSGGVSGSSGVSGQEVSGTGDDAKTTSIGVSVGLEGGASGRAGAVTVDNRATIRTTGARARGIVAQSIGGDGGIGGGATGTVAGDDVAATAAIGGGGGSGAVADRVTVSNAGVIRTGGAQSDGILAQSLGGGGGAGGSAMSINASVKGTSEKSTSSYMLAVGGGGGQGALGGAVAVTNTGTILTNGVSSAGIRAQSIGGGGGLGGGVISAQATLTKNSSTYGLNIGGSGGAGMRGGTVDVVNQGLIYTVARDSAGISASSIGGGGGDGGMILDVVLGVSLNGGNQTRSVMNLGGSGGSGGAAGAVSVVNAPNGTANSGTIITEGAGSYGIFAQSLGGGGGNGSSILSLTAARGNSDSGSIGINIGGFGGDGNVAGSVTVDNRGVIETSGVGAHGVLAQSIGGGGGNGGMAIAGSLVLGAVTKAPILAIGGVGGTGGDGGRVAVTNSGSILTRGANANGIVAQSIGGGGGNAGLALTATGNLPSLALSNGLAALIGGVGGGAGGTGGAVSVVHSGDITVLGAGAEAIVAESINGGGGRMTLDLSGIASFRGTGLPPGGEVPAVALRVGSDDTRDMNAGLVSVTSTGTIGATGANGAGITLQSIGGGGGTVNLTSRVVALTAPAPNTEPAPIRFTADLGATNGANNAGGALAATHRGNVITTGASSPGVIAQSIGGGGGRGTMDLLVEDRTAFGGAGIVLGGSDGANSPGGAIDRRQDGAVQTQGALSTGAIVQSIGGGGGSMLLRVGGITPLDLTRTTSVALGATGGSGNDGGAVSASFAGGVRTDGAHASGLVVQSIGGGGGEIRVAGDSAPQIRLGGTAGASGSGGAVTLVNTGAVFASGTSSHGILVQSIGGGGGIVAGAFAAAGLTFGTANSGNGGAVALRQTGTVSVLGARSYGMVAQSLGGGGGLVDGVFAGTAGGVGRGGAVNLAIDGSVLALADDSTAILAQSLGSLGGGNITIAANGTVRGGSGSGVGVRIDGGADNLLTSSGSLTAVSGLAVVGGAGNDTVVNTGLFVGNAQLGGGRNLLNNAAGGTFVTIDTLQLREGAGSSGTFVNDGDLRLGQSASRYPIDLAAGERFAAYVPVDRRSDLLAGTSIISQVALAGDFVQSATGNSVFDVAFGPYASDRVNVVGNATVAGTADVTLTWLENSNPVPLFATTGGVGVDRGLNVRDTLAIDYSILAGASGINLAFKSDFGLGFLSRNERALGRSLDSAVQAGDAGGIGRLLALLGNLTTGQEGLYTSIMAELDPEIFMLPSLLQLDAARDFGGTMFGCRIAPEDDRNLCTWSNVALNSYDRDSSKGEIQVRPENSARLRAGLDRRFDGGWKVAASFGYDDLGTIAFADTRGQVTGNGLHTGIGLGKEFGTDGRGAASLALSVGRQKNELVRRQTVFATGTGRSRYTTDYVAATGNAGYTIGNVLFARPEVEASAIGIGTRRFTERGLGGLGVEGLKLRDWVYSVAPRLTLGVQPSDSVRLSVTGGGIFRNTQDLTAPFRLIGASDAADPAFITTRFDRNAFTAGANVVISDGERIGVDLGYRAELGKSVESHTARATFRLKF